MGTSDDCIPHFKPLFQAIKGNGTRAFVQLFHPGRELLARRDGVAQVAYSASSSPSERFRIIPRALSEAEIAEIVEGYGSAARRMAEAGADGVEVVGSHGYLPAQFLSAQVNRREDRYGGSFDNRLDLPRPQGRIRLFQRDRRDLGLGGRCRAYRAAHDGEERLSCALRAASQADHRQAGLRCRADQPAAGG
jgi:hypothetical protein